MKKTTKACLLATDENNVSNAQTSDNVFYSSSEAVLDSKSVRQLIALVNLY